VYRITIQHPKEGQEPLVLQTDTRNLARSVAQLARENKLDYEVVTEVSPRGDNGRTEAGKASKADSGVAVTEANQDWRYSLAFSWHDTTARLEGSQGLRGKYQGRDLCPETRADKVRR